MSSTVLALGLILAMIFTDFNNWPKAFRTYALAFIFVIYISKLVIVPFVLVDDIIRFIKWISIKISGPAETGTNVAVTDGISRSEFISRAALIVALIPFTSLIYGMVYGGTDYKVRKRKLSFSNLPKAFNGLKILQISDLHTGSFMTPDPLERAVKIINEQEADIVFFTGDLVNNKTDEVYPFMETLKKIKAKKGIYSILGNHDYGDYVQWETPLLKQKNLTDLYDVHKNLGWQLLRNENVVLEKEGEKIAVAGVENWGASMRFPKYGDLKKAYHGLPENAFTILLSHDPSHWDAQVLEHPHKANITLSGHTHGMQFGIDTKVFKWSPAQYVYPRWAGLYKANNMHLYVNRGLGYLGYPGRAGIRPEITVIELHSA
ncbi:MAG: metallophosphoesterase [Cytophagaceae bacterium]|nr:MAG: metallophosphoesterase [Cytophagaceae bacterium]